MPKSRRKRGRSGGASAAEAIDGWQGDSSSDRRLLAGLIVVVAVAVMAAHWPALSARAMSFDDNQYLSENPLVLSPSWSSAGRFLGEVLEPSTVRGYYQPLAMISLMLDTALGGGIEDLGPYHRTSLALHVANTALIAILLYLLFGRPWVAAIVAMLYGVHPMTVEPIPWVGERKTLLTTFFALACLILYVRYTRTRGWGAFAGAIGAYALALLSKPTSTPLPVLLLLLDYWPCRRLAIRTVVEKIPFLAIGAVSAVVTYISQARTATVAPSDHPITVVPLTLCHNVVFYLYKIVWPTDLSSHYPYPLPFDLSQPMVLLGLIGTCILIPALLLSWRWTRAVPVGWLFFFVAIFPTMGVVGFTHSIASDKYAYLPSIGLLLTLAWAVGWAWDSGKRLPVASRRRIALAAFVLVVSVASVEILAARRQLTHWRDTESHFRYMLSLEPEARILHFGLGDALRKRAQADMRAAGRPTSEARALFDQAADHYRQALRPGPDSPFGRNDMLTCSAHNNLGNILAERGQVDSAVHHWREVLRMNPESYNAHNNVGIAMAMKGRHDEAIVHYAAALRLRHDLPETHNNLGLELAQKGRLDEAIEHYTTALQLNPAFPAALRNLGAAFAAQGKTQADLRAHLAAAGIRSR